MKYLGLVSRGHDASAALVDGEQILFAGHAERYSGRKNDGDVNLTLLDDLLSYGEPQEIVWYERPWLKATREIYSGQRQPFDWSLGIGNHMKELGLDHLPFHTVGHHESHAAAGYFTSNFEHATILVCDAIGEWNTISVWVGEGDKIKKVWSVNYPHSLGLMYSAVTQRCGLKPNEEEYILMGMAALGNKHRFVADLFHDFIDVDAYPVFRLKTSVHQGIKGWKPLLNTEQDLYDLAASMQYITEDYLVKLTQWLRKTHPSKNLVMMGGVALNCKANTQIQLRSGFDNIHIMPNPGDAGSCLGAIAAHTSQRLDWKSPYLGHDIKRPFDYQGAMTALLNGEVIGVANGRAEFGPRSLGNRSLLADPRGQDMKDRVNAIKKREAFRPFAPIVLEEHANRHFEMVNESSPYMQFTMTCREPDIYPAICHLDNTSRVQTLTREQNPTIYHLLRMWYERTGCPMLLNTSLNIKGQPLVDTWEQALEFQQLYGVRVF